jgi:hypothetical protein
LFASDSGKIMPGAINPIENRIWPVPFTDELLAKAKTPKFSP